ncbi:Uncharacterized conserved protein YybS, DUF2232 family [Natronincola peptidivorans]|uniref:Uncharacterized conserved protein YybS, DUF2232 family n=1 Tax=Natronincola peptidivorans TaxID=426128 RepID=A0A1I0B593_9FIRM|nr:YybS family protein [Natronincola peptidivorans]SET01870.1 Uncharacterized conserved protein YybS, DUF2232 family [Natronincola peptidivorans]
MHASSSKKALIEAALTATITTFFVIATLYISILSILLVVLPMPFIILSVRHGTRYTVLSLIISSLLIGFLTNILYTIFVFIIFSPIALAMGYAIRRRKKPYEVIGFGTAASVLAIFFLLQIIAIAAGINITDEIANMTREAIDHQMEMLRTLNLDVVDVKESLNYLMMIIPALVIIHSMIGAFINYYLTAAVINRFNFIDHQLGEFSEFKLPGNIVLGSFIIFVLSLTTRYIEGIQHTSLIANVTIIFLVIFFLQGLTFISYLLKKTKVPRFIRIILVLSLIIISPLMTIVAFLGLLDAILDIRKLKKKK